MSNNKKRHKRTFIAAVTGTLLALVCCFTPALVILLGIAGLSVAVPYLDYFLIPSLLVLIIFTVVSYRKYKNCCDNDSP